jgi:hypothetical protein
MNFRRQDLRLTTGQCFLKILHSKKHQLNILIMGCLTLMCFITVSISKSANSSPTKQKSLISSTPEIVHLPKPLLVITGISVSIMLGLTLKFIPLSTNSDTYNYIINSYLIPKPSIIFSFLIMTS